MDVRIEKTKNRLRQGLLRLLEQKLVEEVTVSELCREAEVNRSTFYVYYDNVNDVFRELVDQFLEEMKTQLDASPEPSLREFLNVYLDTARQHQGVFRAIHQYDIDHDAIRNMTELAASWLDRDTDSFEQIRKDRLYFTYGYSGFFGMVKLWLNNGCRESNEDIISVLRKAGIDAKLI